MFSFCIWLTIWTWPLETLENFISQRDIIITSVQPMGQADSNVSQGISTWQKARTAHVNGILIICFLILKYCILCFCHRSRLLNVKWRKRSKYLWIRCQVSGAAIANVAHIFYLAKR